MVGPTVGSLLGEGVGRRVGTCVGEGVGARVGPGVDTVPDVSAARFLMDALFQSTVVEEDPSVLKKHTLPGRATTSPSCC